MSSEKVGQEVYSGNKLYLFFYLFFHGRVDKLKFMEKNACFNHRIKGESGNYFNEIFLNSS